MPLPPQGETTMPDYRLTFVMPALPHMVMFSETADGAFLLEKEAKHLRGIGCVVQLQTVDLRSGRVLTQTPIESVAWRDLAAVEM